MAVGVRNRVCTLFWMTALAHAWLMFYAASSLNALGKVALQVKSHCFAAMLILCFLWAAQAVLAFLNARNWGRTRVAGRFWEGAADVLHTFAAIAMMYQWVIGYGIVIAFKSLLVISR